MFLNGYSVQVIGYPGDPQVREGDAGYVHITHGQQYKLRLRNRNYRQCDAEVFIDGKHIGTWRLHGYHSAELEHPADDHGKFTAYLTSSAEGRQAGLSPNQIENGLVQVTFRPEKRQDPIYSVQIVDTLGVPSASAFSKGITEASRGAEMGTGLSGSSGQNYGSAGHIEYEAGAEVTISLRLIESNQPRPLSPSLRGNPVPPPAK